MLWKRQMYYITELMWMQCTTQYATKSSNRCRSCNKQGTGHNNMTMSPAKLLIVFSEAVHNHGISHAELTSSEDMSVKPQSPQERQDRRHERALGDSDTSVKSNTWVPSPGSGEGWGERDDRISLSSANDQHGIAKCCWQLSG